MRGKKSMRNRMIRIKIASLMAGLVAAVSLEGCGLLTKSYDFTEAENSIYVEDNATNPHAFIDFDFDKDFEPQYRRACRCGTAGGAVFQQNDVWLFYYSW